MSILIAVLCSVLIPALAMLCNRQTTTGADRGGKSLWEYDYR